MLRVIPAGEVYGGKTSNQASKNHLSAESLPGRLHDGPVIRCFALAGYEVHRWGRFTQRNCRGGWGKTPQYNGPFYLAGKEHVATFPRTWYWDG